MARKNWILSRLPLLVAVFVLMLGIQASDAGWDQVVYQYCDWDSCQDDTTGKEGNIGPRVEYFGAADHQSGSADWAMMIRASDIADSCGVTLDTNYQEPIITSLKIWDSGASAGATACSLKVWHHGSGDTIIRVLKISDYRNGGVLDIPMYADSVMVNVGLTIYTLAGGPRLFWCACMMVHPTDFMR